MTLRYLPTRATKPSPATVEHSTWLRQLSDGRRFPVPVGCVWRVQLRRPDGTRRYFQRATDLLPWDITERSFLAHVGPETGRYYLRPLYPNRRVYDGVPLAYFDWPAASR